MRLYQSFQKMLRNLLVLVTCYHNIGIFSYNTDGVSIYGNREYMLSRPGAENILVCNYTLSSNDTVSTVTWYHENKIIYSWGQPDHPKVGENIKEDEIVLSRNDGCLQFAKLKSDFAGTYMCEIKTSAGKTFRSPNFQLLVVDIPEVPENGNFTIQNCLVEFSWTSPPVYPKPDAKCGVWSVAHSYVLVANKRTNRRFSNHSVSWFIRGEFPIKSMPTDSFIRCELMINKTDGTSIQILENSYGFPEVRESGCPPLEVGEGVDLEYSNQRVTCHKELKPKDSSSPLIAKLKCTKGYLPEYADLAFRDMECKNQSSNLRRGFNWMFDDEFTYPNNFVCVKEIPEKPQPRLKNIYRNTLQRETSSGIPAYSLTWFNQFLVGVMALIQISWTLKALHNGEKLCVA